LINTSLALDATATAIVEVATQVAVVPLDLNRVPAAPILMNPVELVSI
jgi:hypothetical protein